MDTAKQANALIKQVVARLEELKADEKEIARFEKMSEIFNNAAGMTNGNAHCEAALKGWMVSQANNAAFNLWRKGLMTEEIEKAYRELPATEEAVKDYDELEDELKKKAEELEEKRKEFMAGQHDIDIFKAVLNGMPKDKAEEQYTKYQEQISQATRG